MPSDWPAIAQAALIAAGVLLALPVTVLCAEVLAALSARAPTARPNGARAPVAVLIPAHNEAGNIAATIASIRGELRGADRLLVIADNCMDDTAQVARAAGASAIERHDPVRRGKGYALDFGVRHLQQDPAAMVLVVDADCQLVSGSIDALARACAASARPVQGLYLMRAPEHAGPLRRLAQFAWVVRNEVRPRGLQRLGLPCHLMGSGMAFPWRTVAAGQFSSGHLVEDLQLGITLAQSGTPPLFCPEARVTSTFPSDREGVRSQRTRWEHGYLSILLGSGPTLMGQAIRQRSIALLGLALDLAVPPLALLVLLTAALWVGALALALLSARWLALGWISAVLGLLGLAVIVAWLRYGRSILSLAGLALAGVYALAKLPLYLRFLISRQATWVRSRRDSETRRPS